MNNTNTSSNADPIVVNGFTIKPLLSDTAFPFAIDTKKEGTVKFPTQKDARRWARLNNSN